MLTCDKNSAAPENTTNTSAISVHGSVYLKIRAAVSCRSPRFSIRKSTNAIDPIAYRKPSDVNTLRKRKRPFGIVECIRDRVLKKHPSLTCILNRSSYHSVEFYSCRQGRTNDVD